MTEKLKQQTALLAAGAMALTGMAIWMLKSKSESAGETDGPTEVVALLGDIGGTNVRLTLRRLNLKTRTSEEIKPLTKFESQKVAGIDDAIKQFLAEFEKGTEQWPRVGILGVAGEVKENKVCLTNIPHWSPCNGVALSQEFSIDIFKFLNDFAAAGLGVCTLQDKDVVPLNRAHQDPNGVKIVTGPGTGFGQGFIVKSKFAPCHEVYPSEGGHVEFAARSDEDHEIMKFAYNYIENSNNVENGRAHGKLTRISIERVCAGPAVPMLYEFFKTKIPESEMSRVLETGEGAKHPDEIVAKDIVDAAMQRKDPLCTRVVHKFAEILAVEVGNHALKTLPYGGVYLVGGVTMGIRDYIIHDKGFQEVFYAKGRFQNTMRRIPIYVVKPEVELGLIGAEEGAFRELNCFK